MTAEDVQESTGEPLSRRHVLAGAAIAAVGVPVLAACGSDTAEPGGAGSASSGGASSEAPASSAPASSGATGSGALAATADVEVGGAVFLEEPSVVITQPTAGEFHAFSRTCTHQGCPVVDIVDGTIHCDCHQSFFSMTDGSPVKGPATSALAAVDIVVEGDQILPA